MEKDRGIADDTLDFTGLKCPLPTLLAKRALARRAPGSVVTVLADDPLASVDIPHMCYGEGHAVDAVTRTTEGHAFVVRVRSAAAATDVKDM